jgi:hypothetical protein
VGSSSTSSGACWASALLLAARKGGELAFGQVLDTRAREGLGDDGEVVLAVAREGGLVRDAAHQHHVAHAQVEPVAVFLRQHGHGARVVACAALPHVALAMPHLAGAGPQHAVDHAQQRGFATAVGAEQADEFARRDAQADVAHDVRGGRVPVQALGVQRGCR